MIEPSPYRLRMSPTALSSTARLALSTCGAADVVSSVAERDLRGDMFSLQYRFTGQIRVWAQYSTDVQYVKGGPTPLPPHFDEIKTGRGAEGLRVWRWHPIQFRCGRRRDIESERAAKGEVGDLTRIDVHPVLLVFAFVIETDFVQARG